MNIFILDYDPVKAAIYQCDKHVVKMVLESAQLLCAAYDEAPYKRTHYNHRCSVWARESQRNYQWLLAHALALSEEYTSRYGREHKSQSVIEWCSKNIDELTFNKVGLTPFAQSMPEEYQVPDDAVSAYRAYYLGDKIKFAKWGKGRNPPDWWLSKVSEEWLMDSYGRSLVGSHGKK